MKAYRIHQNALVVAVLLFVGIAAAPAYAELLAYDQFTSYAVGQLSGQGQGSGWSGNWSGASQGEFESSGLTYSGLPSAGGNALINSTGGDGWVGVNRTLATPITTDGTYYFGFLFQLPGSYPKHGIVNIQDNSGDGSDYWAGGGRWNGASVFAAISSQGYSAANASTNLSSDVAHVVLKVDFTTSGNSTVGMYVNPADTNALAGAADASKTVSLDNIGVVGAKRVNESGQSGSIAFDEVRVGTASSDMFGAVDSDPPTADLLNPTNGAVNVSGTANLQITFSEAVEAGIGDIIIREVASGTPSETIAVTSAAVTVSSSNVTINPVGLLGPSSNYWVEITNGVIQDLSGTPFAGITNSSDWSFTTASVAIQTEEASNISNVTARLNATLDCPGTNATVIAYWWETGSSTTNSFTNAPYSDETALAVSHTVAGLSPQTSYHFMFRVTNATENIWADSTNTFTTHDVPEVSIGSGASLRWEALTGWTAATLNGAITASNGVPVTNVRIYFGDSNPGAETSDGWDMTNTFTSVTGVESFSTNLTGLDYEITYYYMVYASNAYGDAWSTVTNFTTPRQLWIPTNLAAEAWYDAADETKITLSSGNVSQWDDVSGNGNDATQGTPANQPSTGNDIGGLNALGFDGNNYRLDTSLKQLTNCTMFVVAEPSLKGGGNASLVLSAASAYNGGGLYMETENYGGSDPAFGVRYGTNILSGSQKSYNGEVAASPSVFQQGMFVHWGSGFSTENKNYKIGNRPDNWNLGHYNGTVGEIIIIPSVLSEDDRQKVEGYLAHKWGLEGEFPLDHPYKYDPPYPPGISGTLFRFR